MESFLVDMMVVFVFAVSFGIVFRLLKLPSLVGQVLAGFVIGVWGILGLGSWAGMNVISTFGVTLLLFLVGLEMNWEEIKHSGGIVNKLFWLQTISLLIIFSFIGWGFWGLTPLAACLLSLALTFSSTIVVVKSLAEGKDLGSFAGKISLGMLLMQDILAIIFLTILPSLENGLSGQTLIILFGKIGIMLLAINLVGGFLVSWLLKKVIRSAEDLVLFGLIWLGLAVYLSTVVLGLSPEVGGILAGLSLSTSWGHFQIASKVKPIRDIFLTIFFVLLGFQVGINRVDWKLVLELVVLVIFFKFMVTWLAGLICGLKKKIAFSVSLNMTQISEFSLIVMGIGVVTHQWGSGLMSVVTVAGLLTMVISATLMGEGSNLFRFLAKYIPAWFDMEEGEKSSRLKNHIVLLGGDRTGRSLMSFLKKDKERVLVVDFNPEVVSKLQKKGYAAVFADASDPDVLEITNMAEAKMVISTIKDVNDSLALLTEMKNRGIKVPAIVDAESASQAKALYKAGAAYVIFPHFVSGLHLGQLMKKFEKDRHAIGKYRDRQDLSLKEVYEGDF